MVDQRTQNAGVGLKRLLGSWFLAAFALAQSCAAAAECHKPAEPRPPVIVRTVPAPVQVQCGANTLHQTVTVAPAPAAAASPPRAGKKNDTNVGTNSVRFERLIDLSQWIALGLGMAVALLLLVVIWPGGSGGVSFVTHWGGFGGAGQGWHVSRAGLALAIAAALVAIALVLWMQLLQLARSTSEPTSSQPASTPQAT